MNEEKLRSQMQGRADKAAAKADAAINRLRFSRRNIDERDQLPPPVMAHLKNLEYAIGVLVDIQDTLSGVND